MQINNHTCGCNTHMARGHDAADFSKAYGAAKAGGGDMAQLMQGIQALGKMLQNIVQLMKQLQTLQQGQQNGGMPKMMPQVAHQHAALLGSTANLNLPAQAGAKAQPQAQAQAQAGAKAQTHVQAPAQIDLQGKVHGHPGGPGGAPDNGGKEVQVDHGRIWGDPHFVGADGGKYDVQGEAGKTYNILSDAGVQLNTRFKAWDNPGTTVVESAGISVKGHQVEIGSDGGIKINGEGIAFPAVTGQDFDLPHGLGTKKADGSIEINAGEYELVFKNFKSNAKSGHWINDIVIRSSNANADGVMPHGLWGVTVDGDGQARNGDRGKGAQGGGAIETLDGSVTNKGDKNAVTNYEVADLFDTNFANFNTFHEVPKTGGGHGWAGGAGFNINISAQVKAQFYTGGQGGADHKEVKVEQGRIWGDPHFVGADGGKYDVQGEAGKTYNILSDTGIQMNAKFKQWNHPGTTVVEQVGFSTDKGPIKINADGSMLLQGDMAIPAGRKNATYMDGAVTVNDKGHITVKAGEYEVTFDKFAKNAKSGEWINNIEIRSDNANSDGKLPTGLWGATVDGDGKARNGDKGKGTQGGGAIEDLHGNITKRGDKETVKLYEVNDLFETDFKNFNAFQPAHPAGWGNMNFGAGAWASHMAFAQIGVNLNVNVNLNANGYQQVPYQYHKPIEAKIEGADTIKEGGWNTKTANGKKIHDLKKTDVKETGTNAQEYRVTLNEPAKEDMILKVKVGSDDADQLTRDPKMSDLTYDPTGRSGAARNADDLKADYSIYGTDGKMVKGDIVEVLIKKGETQSEAFKVQAWQETGRYGKEQAEGDEKLCMEIVGAGPCVKTEHKEVTIKDQKTATASPIAFDMNGDGAIGTTGVSTAKDRVDGQIGDTVQFDIDGDGTKDQIEWMSGDGDALLVDNRDGNAAADMSGARLFGDQGGQYANGYEKLSQLDTNGDGQLTGAELDGLELWKDDGDAVVEAGEMVSAAEAGVTRISTQMTLEANERGEDLMRSAATIAGEDVLTEDVWFAEET